ncbi:MAG TPA: EF-hand domain-containing protein [Allosphingosinicella sp.]|nr:EF-hand domain-containing protein [Allosphingosinicella sp.]
MGMIFGSAIALLIAQATTAAPAATATPAQAAPQPTTKASIQARVGTAFDRLDTNKDGWVDRAEAQKAMDARNAAAAKQRSDAIAAAFTRLDTNKDGSLNRQEFTASITPYKAPPGLPYMDGYDTDKNGRVSLSEATAAAMATFDKVDRDRNGVLSEQEERAAAAAEAAQSK